MLRTGSIFTPVSSRDEDKVAGAGLTVEFTQLGNPIYAEADLAIECKKLYSQQFDAELLPAEHREWYEKSGLGIHYMYIGKMHLSIEPETNKRCAVTSECNSAER